MEPDAVEIRVLGCLIEKQRTTPDAYPLSLNALRLACNQSTNRSPVVDYDEGVIKDALQHTYRRGWTRLASGHGSRAAKYRHLLDEALGLAPDELALLAVLMLRGPQTPGELKQRSERLQRFVDLAAVEATLERLIDRGHAERLPRQPGQKEERYRQLLGGEDGAPAPAPAPSAAPLAAAAPVPPAGDADPAGGREDARARVEDLGTRAGGGQDPPAAAPDPQTERRLDQLEREIAALRAELSELRNELGA